MAVRSACARARATRGSSGRGARGARGGIRSRLGRRAGPAQGTRAPRLARASGALDLCPDWDHALDQASTDRRGDGAAQAGVRRGAAPGGAAVAHRARDEPESPRAQGQHRAVPRDHVRPFPPVAGAAGAPRPRLFRRARLLLLTAGARARPPGRGRRVAGGRRSGRPLRARGRPRLAGGGARSRRSGAVWVRGQADARAARDDARRCCGAPQPRVGRPGRARRRAGRRLLQIHHARGRWARRGAGRFYRALGSVTRITLPRPRAEAILICPPPLVALAERGSHATGERIMHAVFRRYRIRLGAVQAARERAPDGLVPDLRRVQGFAAYYLVHAGNDTLASIALFQTEESAAVGERLLNDWFRHDWPVFQAVPPELTRGAVLVHEELPRVAVAVTSGPRLERRNWSDRRLNRERRSGGGRPVATAAAGGSGPARSSSSGGGGFWGAWPPPPPARRPP